MTAPVPHGYPDWQPQRPSVDTQLIEIDNIVVAGTDIRGPFFTGNFPILNVEYIVDVGRARIRFRWFRDIAGLLFLTQHEVLADPTAPFHGTVPVLGPTLEAVIDNEDAGNSTFDLKMWLGSLPGARQDVSDKNILVRRAGVSVASGGGQDITRAARVWPGPAALTFDTTAVDNDIRVEHLTNAGTWNRIYMSRDRLHGEGVTLFLPYAPVRTVATNNDAAAKIFDVHLLGQPGIGGT